MIFQISARCGGCGRESLILMSVKGEVTAAGGVIHGCGHCGVMFKAEVTAARLAELKMQPVVVTEKAEKPPE